MFATGFGSRRVCWRDSAWPLRPRMVSRTPIRSVENCRRYGLPVEAYLKQLLQMLPGLTDETVIATLTPARIADARRRKSRVA